MDLRGLGLSEEDLAALGYEVQGEGAEEPRRPIPRPAPPRDRAPRSWLWTLAILLLMGWGASSSRRLPSPVPANRPDTVFSSARAMSQLVEIARRPHPLGSPEHERVVAHLVGRFRSLGLNPEVENLRWATGGSGTVHSFNLKNILVRVPGAASTGTILLTAHYDSPPLSPGAGDDGIGVAAILETVRALVASEPLKNDVLVLLSDGGAFGEAGLRGFAERGALGDPIAVVIAAEMRGVRGPAVTFERLPRNGRLIRVMASADPGATATSLTRALPSPLLLLHDHPSIWDTGVLEFDLAGLGGLAFHRQVLDRAGEVSEKTLQHQGAQLLALARGFGTLDFGRFGMDGVGSEQAYLTLPWIGLIHHPVSWTEFLSLALLSGWVLLVVFFRLRGASYKGMVGGLLMAGVILAASAALGWGLLTFARSLHPEYGMLQSAFFRDDLHQLSLAALVVALASATYVIARMRFSREELIPGALAIPVGLAAWWGFRVPFGGVVLQWAVALSIPAAALVPGLGRTGRWRLAAWASTLLLTGGILAIVVPNLEILAAVLTFRAAAWTAAALALSLLLVLPATEWLYALRPWWLPVIAVAAAVVPLVASLPVVQGPEDHPTFSSLVYLVDGELEGPLPVADLLDETRDSAEFRQVTGRWLTLPGPGEEWARSWVAAEEEEGNSNAGELLLPPGTGFELVGRGPDTRVPFPGVWVLEDSGISGNGRLRLMVLPRLGGEMVGIRILGDKAEITRIGERDWRGEAECEAIRTAVHWGGLEEGSLSVDLGLPEEPPNMLRIEILEHHLRPEAILGDDFFRRDRSLIANAPAGSDRVIQRTLVSIPLAPSAEGLDLLPASH